MEKHPKNADDEEINQELLERLRDKIQGAPSFLDEMIDLDCINGHYGGIDGRITLNGVIRCLVVLCGSEDAAIWWLFHSKSYHEIAGSDPILGGVDKLAGPQSD